MADYFFVLLSSYNYTKYDIHQLKSSRSILIVNHIKYHQHSMLTLYYLSFLVNIYQSLQSTITNHLFLFRTLNQDMWHGTIGSNIIKIESMLD